MQILGAAPNLKKNKQTSMGKSYRADAKFEKYKKRDKKQKGHKKHNKFSNDQGLDLQDYRDVEIDN